MSKKIIKLADCPAKVDIESLKEYRETGINTYVLTEDHVPFNTPEYVEVIKKCKQVGLDVFIRGYSSADYFDGCAIDFNEFDNITGFYLWDEPNGEEFEEVAKLIPFMSEKYPDKLWHVNLFPSYGHPKTQLRTSGDEQHSAHENYVDAYVEKVLKKVTNKKDISLDYYPLRHYVDGDKKGQTFVCDTWLLDLYTVKSREKDSGASIFNTCIQVYRDSGTVRDIRSKADISFQVYTSLAFGAKSLEYYLYRSYEDDMGMINHDGTRSPSYYYVKDVNADLETFESIFVEYDWQGVTTYTAGEKNSSFEYLKGKTIEKPFGVEKIDATADTLVGSLVHENGSKAIVVVNYNCPEHKIKDKVNVTFEKVVTATVYQNGGKTVYENVKQLSLYLNEGDGAFVTF